MSVDTPPVWFERWPPAATAGEVMRTVELLGPGEKTPDDPFRWVTDALGIVAGAWIYDDSVMALGPRLRVISRTGIGVDRVDVAAATARGIAVCNAPDGPTVPTAEHTVALMLAAAKRIQRAEAFRRHSSVELDGKSLGLVGIGRIARRVARIASAIGMHVKAYDPYVAGFPADVQQAATLHEALGADVVSLHLPLTEDTRGIIDADALASMPVGAIFVNTARGPLVDHEALLRALDDGHLSAAALDVTDPEPLPDDHPLRHRDDVIVTPHVASATPEGKQRMFQTAFDQVLDVLSGRRPEHIVNPEVLDAA